MLTDDLARIDLVARTHEEDATIGEPFERIARDATRFQRHHDAVLAARKRAARGLVAREGVVHDRFTAAGVKDARAHADEAARRNLGFNMHATSALFHLGNLCAARAKQLKRCTETTRAHIERESLVGFPLHTVNHSFDDFRLTNGELEAFTTHIFQQHAQVKQTAT